jgi:dsDNA-binding SOS-regulon protein
MLLCEDIAEQKVLFGSQLSEEQEKALLMFLFNNKDVFAWSANDQQRCHRALSQCRPNYQTEEAEASKDVK